MPEYFAGYLFSLRHGKQIYVGICWNKKIRKVREIMLDYVGKCNLNANQLYYCYKGFQCRISLLWYNIDRCQFC